LLSVSESTWIPPAAKSRRKIQSVLPETAKNSSRFSSSSFSKFIFRFLFPLSFIARVDAIPPRSAAAIIAADYISFFIFVVISFNF
jgi:hypothetical protein